VNLVNRLCPIKNWHKLIARALITKAAKTPSQVVDIFRTIGFKTILKKKFDSAHIHFLLSSESCLCTGSRTEHYPSADVKFLQALCMFQAGKTSAEVSATLHCEKKRVAKFRAVFRVIGEGINDFLAIWYPIDESKVEEKSDQLHKTAQPPSSEFLKNKAEELLDYVSSTVRAELADSQERALAGVRAELAQVQSERDSLKKLANELSEECTALKTKLEALKQSIKSLV
jgi:cytochrome c556